MKVLYSSLISSGVSTVLCNPLEVIRLNIQSGKYTTVGETVKSLYKTNGVIAFYRGLGFSLTSIPSFWVIYFNFYEKTKTIGINNSIGGYISSCLASTITAPIWFVRQKKLLEPEFNLYKTIKNNGFKPFYNTILPTYFINMNFIFNVGIYEKLKKSLPSQNSLNILMCSTTAKFFSTLITYPIDTIRVMIRNQKPEDKLIDTFRLIKKWKPSRFYNGLGVYLLKGLPQQGCMFVVYEFLKKY